MPVWTCKSTDSSHTNNRTHKISSKVEAYMFIERSFMGVNPIGGGGGGGGLCIFL